MTATSTLSVDKSSTAGPFGSAFATVAGHDTGQKIEEQFADARHLAATVTTANHSFHLVVYDGVAYVSTNGRTYQSAPFVTTILDQLSASAVQGYAAHLTGTVDHGASTQDGVVTERYNSTVDPAYVSSLLTNVVSSIIGGVTTSKVPAATVSDLVAAMHFQDINLTWYVNRSTGHLVRELTSSSIDVDLGTVMAAIAGRGRWRKGDAQRHAGPPGDVRRALHRLGRDRRRAQADGHGLRDARAVRCAARRVTLPPGATSASR